MKRSKSSVRSAALDQLRACAILSVIFYHVVQMSPVPLPNIVAYTWYGKYGVDLFFVLSGWLVGGLYWRELQEFGRVNIQRFWTRRWMRTLPPYLVVLAIAWFAVWWGRREPFDWAYLAFLQNYYQEMPFFVVSWSLCIEEHFYLLMPVAAGVLVATMSRRAFWIPWFILMFLAPLFRWIEWIPDERWRYFGYPETATHLRLDGLVLGFGLSYVATFAPTAFRRLAWCSMPVVAMSLVGLVLLELIGGVTRYVLWPSVVAVLCAGLVVFGTSREARVRRPFAANHLSAWKAVAVSAYSAYLIHPLAIHVARRIAAIGGPDFWLLYWPVVAALIGLATLVLYISVESPSIVLRDAPKTRIRRWNSRSSHVGGDRGVRR